MKWQDFFKYNQLNRQNLKKKYSLEKVGCRKKEEEERPEGITSSFGFSRIKGKSTAEFLDWKLC